MIENAYIHIPFCLRKCKYCSFISGKNIKQKEEYITALIKEIKTNYKGEKLKTLYFGGGTPSLLDIQDLETIINIFDFQKNPEITLETNPETVTFEKFSNIKKIGINRISLGVQSFNNNILKYIGRNHTEQTIYNSIKNIKSAGFKNISIDLIYGLPNQTFESFESDLHKAINLDVQHISSYGLKIEPDSYFFKNPPENLPDDDMQAKMFLYMCNELKKNNFVHYEISNFSKTNFESEHNCSYWKNKNYYGFGLNASGYENNCRYKNTADFEEYINNPLKKEEELYLSDNEIIEEEIFLALRLKDGIDIEEINKKFNIDFEKKYKNIIEKYFSLKLLTKEDNHIKLTENGILLSNEIMSEFID